MTHQPANDNAPRLMGRKDAAAYCGITPTCFSMWVASHKMPPAIPGTRKWDKRAIDAKLDEISGLGVNDNKAEGGLTEWRRKRDARKAQRANES
ncbi:helix-turn-helix transcriptional regulator [Rhizobium ruizarguesonis]